MKNKIPKIIKAFDFPLQKGFYVEMFSEQDITITGNITVEQLENEIICLKCGEKLISIFGKKLVIISYSADSIRISGLIKKLEFLE